MTTWIVQAGVDVLHLPGKVVQVSVRSYRNGVVVSLSVLEVHGRLHLYRNEVVGGQLLLVEVFCTSSHMPSLGVLRQSSSARYSD